MKKNIISSYSAPEVSIFEVVAERGYSASAGDIFNQGTTLPGFGSEDGGELIYDKESGVKPRFLFSK